MPRIMRCFASIVFFASSVVTSARAERYATGRVAAIWTGAFALAVLVAVTGEGIGPTIVFLIAAGLTTGVLVALTYPLGAAGAAHGGFNVAVVGALLNIIWAGSGLLGPMIGGALAEAIGDRPWFVGLSVCAMGAAAWIWRSRDVPIRVVGSSES